MYDIIEAREPPTSAGEVLYNQKIVDIGRSGDGITKIGAFVIFVPYTKIGDKVDIKIIRVMENFAFGEIVEDEM